MINNRGQELKPESNAIFLIDRMDAALIIIDDKENIIKVNRSAENLFKAVKEELINKKIKSIFKDFDIDNIKDTVRTSDLKIIKRNLFVESISEESTFVSLSIVPIFNNEKKYSGSIVTCSDISDKIELINQLSASQNSMKKQKDEIAIERDKFHMVIENISDGILVMDSSYNIFHYNTPLAKVINIKSNMLMNSNLKQYFREVYYSDLIRKKQYFKSEEIIITMKEDHSKKILKIHLAPIIIEGGKDLNLVLTIRDVTKEREMDEMKTQFVSNVPHELRTPLSSIKGFASTLLHRKGLNEKQKNNFLNIINDESDRLTRLIEDLLSLSRIESSTLKLDFVAFDLIKTCEVLKEEFENQLKKKDLKKDLKIGIISTGAIPNMIADKDKIIQLLINLVNNAIKFTNPDTHIEIKLSYNKIGKFFLIIIKDYGPGISKENINKIFNKFFRVEDQVHSIEGTGLGLSIVKRIVEKHKGRISVKSKIKQWTAFNVEIPQGKIINHYQ